MAGAEIDDGGAEMLAAGKCQQLTGQAFAALGRRLDRLDGPRQFRIEQPLEDLGVAADDHQQIVEVVGDAAGQFADRLHFLRHGELLARLDQLLLGVAPLGGVAQHIGKADQIAVVVVDRPDRSGDEEQRAVLFDAPPLDGVLAVLDGQFEHAVRFARAPLVGPVEHAEMLADDFVGGVADDLLRGRVPARHAPRSVEQENRVIDDAFDQDLEMALGPLEGERGLGDLPAQLVMRGL